MARTIKKKEKGSVSPLPKDYCVDYYDFTNESWDDYVEYHASKLEINIDDLKSAMTDIGVDTSTIESRIKEIENSLDQMGASTKAKGNFGEAQSAYYLEKKKNHILLPIGWAKEPFTGHTSIDLYGIDDTRQHITYIESKAAIADSSYSGLITQLIEKQLSLKRIMSFTQIGNTSIIAISKALQSETILNSDFSLQKEELEKLCENPIMRIGVILHKIKGKNEHEDHLVHLQKDEEKWKTECPDGKQHDCIPTMIVDLKNQNIKEWYEKWILLADLAFNIRPR